MAEQTVQTEKDLYSAGTKAYVLFILVVVYTFNFIDRTIISILAPPIKEDLGLSDTQLGLLGGTAFALFYTSLGIPVARLADRTSRTWIMTISLTLWSGFTALCGVAQTFVHLFLARLGVGVGEAGGTAPAYALISDYFPQSQRARALAIYAFGIPIGSALGLVLGGTIAAQVDWRTAFIVVGIAGIAIAPIFRLTVREPVRGGLDNMPLDETPPSPGEVLAMLWRKPSFWGLSFGAASSSIMTYGTLFWMPSYFQRTYAIPIDQVSLFFGGIVFIGGVLGVLLGGTLADRFGARSKAAYALVSAIALFACVPFYLAGVLAVPPLLISFFIFIVPAGLSLVWIGPVTSAVQHLVTPGMRATASAIFLFINNLIGLGAGTVLIGGLSDLFRDSYGEDSLRYAILAGTGFFVLAGTIFVLTSLRLEKDWER